MPYCAKVFAQLVSLIFAVDGLDWSSPGQHVETFAGAMSVTRGEWQDRTWERLLMAPQITTKANEGDTELPVKLRINPNPNQLTQP